MKKLFRIMLSAVIVLTIMSATVTTCFASDEISMPLQAQIWIDGEHKGNVGTVSEFNDFLKNHPGSGKMELKVNNDARGWYINEQIVIPENAEYEIVFCAPTNFLHINYGKTKASGSLFLIKADHATIDLSCGGDLWHGYSKTDYGAFAYITGDDVTIKNCAVVGAGANNYGGGIYTEGERTSIKSCYFGGCSAEYGGAIYSANEGLKIDDCTFDTCASTKDGGAIYTNHIDSYIQHCTFKNCSTDKGRYGGAIYANWGDPMTIWDCEFENCSTNGGRGEAICLNDDRITVYDCKFHDMVVSSCICDVDSDGDEEVKFDYCKFYNNKPVDGKTNYIDIWGLSMGVTDVYLVDVIDCTTDNPNENAFYKCNKKSSSSGTAISEGNGWIVAAIGAAAVIAVAAVVVSKKKKA